MTFATKFAIVETDVVNSKQLTQGRANVIFLQQNASLGVRTLWKSYPLFSNYTFVSYDPPGATCEPIIGVSLTDCFDWSANGWVGSATSTTLSNGNTVLSGVVNGTSRDPIYVPDIGRNYMMIFYNPLVASITLDTANVPVGFSVGTSSAQPYFNWSIVEYSKSSSVADSVWCVQFLGRIALITVPHTGLRRQMSAS
jgi:hypothetical protein